MKWHFGFDIFSLAWLFVIGMAGGYQSPAPSQYWLETENAKVYLWFLNEMQHDTILYFVFKGYSRYPKCLSRQTAIL